MVAILATTLNGHTNLLSASGNLLLTLLILELTPLVAMLIYRVGFDGGSGQSVGRAAVRTRLVVVEGDVTQRVGARVSYGRALGRLIVGGLGDLLLGLGSLSMLWHPQRRTWSDVSTGTAVIRDASRRPGAGRVLSATVTAMAVLTAVGAYAGVREHRLIAREQSVTAQQHSNGPLPSVGAGAPSDGSGTAPSPPSPAPSTDSTSSTPSPAPGNSLVSINEDTPLASEIGGMLDGYFGGINSGQYAAAWVLLDTSEQARNGTLGDFTDQLSTSTNASIELHQAVDNGDGTYSASVTFRSTQDGSRGVNPGETCTDWSLVYRLVTNGAGGYLIDDVTVATHSAC